MQSLAHLERQQRSVFEMSKESGNDRCADCSARFPRWASTSLGIFLCASCATVHRRLDGHLSQVKSLTHEPWSREEVAHMREVGNVRSNQYYDPEPSKHPPPTDIDPGVRGELEVYIRRKYERRDFVRKDPVQNIGSSRLQMRHPSASERSDSSRRPVSRHMLGGSQNVPHQPCTTGAATTTTHVNNGAGALSTNGYVDPAVLKAQFGVSAPQVQASPVPPTQPSSGSPASPSVYSDLLDLQDGPPLVHTNYAMPSAVPYPSATMAFVPSHTPMTSYMAPVPTGMHYAPGMYAANPMMVPQGMAPYPTWLYPTQ